LSLWQAVPARSSADKSINGRVGFLISMFVCGLRSQCTYRFTYSSYVSFAAALPATIR
jgi:hypothetical protein